MELSRDSLAKYTQKLNTNDLSVYLKEFRVWAMFHGLNELQIKCALPLMIKDSEFNWWFSVNARLFTDHGVKFDEFISKIFAECPTHDYSRRSLLEVLTEKPRDAEMASSYLLRIRFLAGPLWSQMREEALCNVLIGKLLQKLRLFIDIRGRPETIDGLNSLVKQLEKNNDSRTLIQSPQITSTPLPGISEKVAEVIKNLRQEFNTAYQQLISLKGVDATPKIYPWGSNTCKQHNNKLNVRMEVTSNEKIRTTATKYLPVSRNSSNESSQLITQQISAALKDSSKTRSCISDNDDSNIQQIKENGVASDLENKIGGGADTAVRIQDARGT